MYFNYFVGRAGVPLEVMGLMLGEFVDDYTVKVVDVFAMPQKGREALRHFIFRYGCVFNKYVFYGIISVKTTVLY